MHILKEAPKTGIKMFLEADFGRGKGNLDDFRKHRNRSPGEPVGILSSTSLKEGDIV